MVILNYYRNFLGSSPSKQTEVVATNNGADGGDKHTTTNNIEEHSSHNAQDGTDNLDSDLDILDNVKDSSAGEYYQLDHLKNNSTAANLASVNNSSKNSTAEKPHSADHINATADNSEHSLDTHNESDKLEAALEELNHSIRNLEETDETENDEKTKVDDITQINPFTHE